MVLVLVVVLIVMWVHYDSMVLVLVLVVVLIVMWVHYDSMASRIVKLIEKQPSVRLID